MVGRLSGGTSAGLGGEGRTAERILGFIESKPYRCPCCDVNFTERHVRINELAHVGEDTDLRPFYSPVDPVLYDVVVCGKCGYGSIEKTFHNLSFKKAQIIMSQLPQKFKNIHFPKIYTEDIAISRYKQALMCALLTREKSGELAYIYRRLAWIYRSMGEYGKEKKMLAAALEGFVESARKDYFPIVDIDEETACYIIADLAWRLNRTDDASYYFDKLLNGSVSSDIKRLVTAHQFYSQ